MTKRGRDKSRFGLRNWRENEAGTEVFNSEKQEEIHENYFLNFCEFRLI